MEHATEERLALLAEWKKISAEWKPKDYHGHGCISMLAGVVLFVGLPKLVPLLPFTLPVWARLLVAALAVILVVGGFILMGSRRLQAAPADLVGRAADALAAGGLDAEARRTAAVTILFHRWDFRGPTMSSNFDPAAILPRLGASADYVIDVERMLIEELGINPVFTAPE